MDVIRNSFALKVFYGQLWVVGGWDNDNGDTLDSCEYLDAASNTWMAGPSMITGRRGHGLAVLDGYLWAVGGYGVDGWEGGPLRSSERLNPATNVWVAGPDLPRSTPYDLSCVVF